jgi:hypothetical protein
MGGLPRGLEAVLAVSDMYDFAYPFTKDAHARMLRGVSMLCLPADLSDSLVKG